MAQRISNSSNSSKVPRGTLAPSDREAIVALVTREFDRLSTLHALAVTSTQWHAASMPTIAGLRAMVLSPAGIGSSHPLRTLALHYAQSRLLHRWHGEPADILKAVSHGIVSFLIREPATSGLLKYSIGILPALKSISNEQWDRLTMSMPKQEYGLMLFKLTACFSEQSDSLLEDNVTWELEQSGLRQNLLLSGHGLDKHLPPLLDQLVQIGWLPEAARALFRALQTLPSGASKQAAVQALLAKDPPLPILLDALNITDPVLDADGEPLNKPDVQLRCLVLAKALSHAALRKKMDAARMVMLALSNCADGLSGKNAKNAFFLSLKTNFRNLKPLAIKESDLLCLLCKRAKDLQSTCKEAKAFLAGLELHGIVYKGRTLTTPNSSKS